jgi:hypothetical protein
LEEYCLLECFHGGVNSRCPIGLCTAHRLHGTKSKKSSLTYSLCSSLMSET